MELCKPANLLLLVSVAGALYHLIVFDVRTAMWWVAVGILGVTTFQGLCMSGFENMSWLLMLLPVLVVCFFLAVALLASSMRIKNVHREEPRCKEESRCHKKPRCNEERGCHKKPRCNSCGGNGCSSCVKINEMVWP